MALSTAVGRKSAVSAYPQALNRSRQVGVSLRHVGSGPARPRQTPMCGPRCATPMWMSRVVCAGESGLGQQLCVLGRRGGWGRCALVVRWDRAHPEGRSAPAVDARRWDRRSWVCQLCGHRELVGFGCWGSPGRRCIHARAPHEGTRCGSAVSRARCCSARRATAGQGDADRGGCSPRRRHGRFAGVRAVADPAVGLAQRALRALRRRLPGVPLAARRPVAGSWLHPPLKRGPRVR